MFSTWPPIRQRWDVLPEGCVVKSLIADDDFACRFLLQTFLSRYGDCEVALDGGAAVIAFEAAAGLGAPFDLICMDIMMPGMDGKEAARRVRAREKAAGVSSGDAVKIIMTTAIDEERDDIEMFHEHCDAYLEKPIDLRLLLNRLKQLKLVGEIRAVESGPVSSLMLGKDATQAGARGEGLGLIQL